jgi:hypothetical protein
MELLHDWIKDIAKRFSLKSMHWMLQRPRNTPTWQRVLGNKWIRHGIALDTTQHQYIIETDVYIHFPRTLTLWKLRLKGLSNPKTQRAATAPGDTTRNHRQSKRYGSIIKLAISKQFWRAISCEHQQQLHSTLGHCIQGTWRPAQGLVLSEMQRHVNTNPYNRELLHDWIKEIVKRVWRVQRPGTLWMARTIKAYDTRSTNTRIQHGVAIQLIEREYKRKGAIMRGISRTLSLWKLRLKGLSNLIT